MARRNFGIFRRPAPCRAARRGKRCGCMNASVLLLLAAGTGLAPADPIDLKPFQATYTRRMERHDGRHPTLELQARRPRYLHLFIGEQRARHVPHGFSRFPGQTSTFRLGRPGPAPAFRGIHEKEREINLDFDWDRKSPVWPRAMPSTCQLTQAHRIPCPCRSPCCAVSPPVIVPHGAADRQRQAQGLRIAAGGQRALETALGELDTVIYTTRRAGTDRTTRTWVAPALGYLPVKAERFAANNKLEFTLVIESVE